MNCNTCHQFQFATWLYFGEHYCLEHFLALLEDHEVDNRESIVLTACRKSGSHGVQLSEIYAIDQSPEMRKSIFELYTHKLINFDQMITQQFIELMNGLPISSVHAKITPLGETRLEAIERKIAKEQIAIKKVAVDPGNAPAIGHGEESSGPGNAPSLGGQHG